MDKKNPFPITRRLAFDLLVFATLVLFTVSCNTHPDYSPGTSVSLADFSKNSVTVSVQLERDTAGNFYLAATYTPIDGYHLYSKDIPRKGVDGVGRPTLLELTSDSKLQATGGLIENPATQSESLRPHDLLIYPAGPVTLKLPVLLPDSKKLMDDSISISYMACSSSTGICKPPVEGEIIKIKIPGNKYVP
jgi:hypothetical protein